MNYLRQGLDLIRTDGCSCCPGSVDLHFWLSLRQGEIQAQTIADALIDAFPEHAEKYRANLQNFLQELRALDQTIQTLLAPLKNRTIFVSHPAYAYFARDYKLEQFSVEVEGKDPTPLQMTKLLHQAKTCQVKTLFIQLQYNNKAAKLVADTLGAKLVVLNPYSENYFDSLLEIAHAFADHS